MAAPNARTASLETRIDYRPDIDGLRALAVALVVGFHFGVPGIAGGYLGVDLFFVISGYLIATIFERRPELTLSNLARFYGRRIKRLMPAFVVVASVTIIVSTFLLLPDDYVALLRSVRDSLAFSANVYFERQTTGYFAANASQLPWLHTWSLSIEWQFYLLFPLVVLLLRPLRSWRARSTALAGLVVAGIAWSATLVGHDAARAYFSTSARGFEFLLGALAAALPPRSDAGPDAGPRRARWIATAGVIALCVLANRFDAATAFPGLPAALVCLLGGVVIVAGARGSPLSSAPLAWVGRRSYSIYLWHWPMVALTHYLQFRPSPVAIVAGILALLVLADLTYRFVELPGIALAWRPTRSFAIGCVLPYVCIAAALVFVRQHDGFAARLGPQAAHAQAMLDRYEPRGPDACHDRTDGDMEPCAFGDLRSSIRVLLIGDSHARHFRPFLRVLADDARLKAYGLTNSECPTLEGASLQIEPGRRAGCTAAIARDYTLIRDGHFRFVVLAERWFAYATEEDGALARSLDAIVASGATPVIVSDIAEDDTNPHDCFYRNIKLRRAQADDCRIARDNRFAFEEKARFARLLQTMRRAFPTLIVIDPLTVQCDGSACATVIDATPIYVDPHHLDAFGSTMLGRAYLARFGNPLGTGEAGKADR